MTEVSARHRAAAPLRRKPTHRLEQCALELRVWRARIVNQQEVDANVGGEPLVLDGPDFRHRIERGAVRDRHDPPVNEARRKQRGTDSTPDGATAGDDPRLVAVIHEVRRLHICGLTRERVIAQVNSRRYALWYLAEHQAPIAVRREYDELERRLR